MKNNPFYFESMNILLERAFKHIVSAHEFKLTGVQCGFPRIDSITGGWQKGSLITIASPPFMGKTSFILSIARNAAVDFIRPVGIFSIEPTKMQILMRLISLETGIHTRQLFNGELRNEEINLINEKTKGLMKSSILIDDSPSISIEEFYGKAKRFKEMQGAELIIINCLYYERLMELGDYSEWENCNVFQRLKEIAKELDIPIIVVLQMGEAGIRNRPQLSDLRHPFDVEKDSDVIIFLNRPESYGIVEDEKGNSTVGIVELIVAKHNNGRIGNARLFFNPHTGSFSET